MDLPKAPIGKSTGATVYRISLASLLPGNSVFIPKQPNRMVSPKLQQATVISVCQESGGIFGATRAQTPIRTPENNNTCDVFDLVNPIMALKSSRKLSDKADITLAERYV